MHKFTLVLIALAGLLLAACKSRPVVVERTVVATQLVPGTPDVQTVTATPAPTPREPRILTICLGQEPSSLYLYGGSGQAMASVLHAVYDGPSDRLSYGYRPVILEKIPSLADGDTAIEKVDVSTGDRVVDAIGDAVTLQAGVTVRPSGCREDDCAVTYSGDGPLAMDRMSATFRLLEGLTWSDGVPLTAADSVYSFNLAADPQTPGVKTVIARTESYLALDERTLQWNGLPGFLDPNYFLNFWTPLPEHAWGPFTPAELLSAELSSRKPLGWGPYVIEAWEPGERIRLHRNPNYFRAPEGLPAFDQLIFRFVGEDTNVSLSLLLSGECDLVDQTARMSDQGRLLLELEASGQMDAVFGTSVVWEHVDFGIVPAAYDNGWRPGDRPDLFADVRTRQAIATCMDRQAAVEAALFGQSIVLDTYLPPDHPLFNPNAARYPFDVAAGSALLEEAGWLDEDGDPATPRVYRGANLQIPQGTPLAFDYWTTAASQRSQVAEILVGSLAACGIQANLQLWSPEELFAGGPEGPLFGRRFDLGQLAWQASDAPPCHLYLGEAIPGDPAAFTEAGSRRFPYGWGGWNETGYASEAYDAACKAAQAALPGEGAYLENHLRAQEIFAQDLPAVPLYLHLNMAVSRPDLCGLLMDATASSELWNLEAFDYGTPCENS